MPYIFKTPVVEEGPIGSHRLWQFYRLERGITVFRIDGNYYETQSVSQEEMDMADVVYLGGHEYEVSDEEADNLIDAGYEEFLTEI